ncbi:MAG: hypothetical protein KHZ24_05700 [Coriobacteriia bacterium]|nr:hypothetical protein [Coriobacteriia bacterium]
MGDETNGERLTAMPDGADLIYDPKPGTVGVTLSYPDAESAVLKVLAPAAEVAEALAAARASLARRCGLPDDSEGLTQLNAQVDEAAVTSYTAGFVLDRLSSAAFMRVGVMPFGTPDVTVDELPQADHDLSFEVRVLVRPHGELTDYDTPVTIDVAPEPSDADVDAWIDAMAHSLAEQAGKDASAPVIDDAWVIANMPEAGDLAGLRKRVRDLLNRPRASKALDDCAFALAQRLAAPVGERYVDVLLEEERDRAAQELAEQGATLDEYCKQKGISLSAWEDERRELVRKRLSADVALDALADHFELQVDEKYIKHALEHARVAELPATYDELAWCAETGQTHRLCEYALRLGATEYLYWRAIRRPAAEA